MKVRDSRCTVYFEVTQEEYDLLLSLPVEYGIGFMCRTTTYHVLREQMRLAESQKAFSLLSRMCRMVERLVLVLWNAEVSFSTIETKE